MRDTTDTSGEKSGSICLHDRCTEIPECIKRGRHRARSHLRGGIESQIAARKHQRRRDESCRGSGLDRIEHDIGVQVQLASHAEDLDHVILTFDMHLRAECSDATEHRLGVIGKKNSAQPSGPNSERCAEKCPVRDALRSRDENHRVERSIDRIDRIDWIFNLGS
jgi:hypothetical protein